jgi:oligogalacturonide lyase
MKTFTCITITAVLMLPLCVLAQPVLETGGGTMPDEWIDKSTGHKIIRLTRMGGSSVSFYFHNNPFIGNSMVFYNSSRQKGGEATDMRRQETYNLNVQGKQLWLMDLTTLKVKQLTNHPLPMNGEIVSAATKEVFFQVKDSVYAVHTETMKQRLVFVFPADFKAGITTVNADGTLLGGAWSTDAEKEISKNFPNKGDFFTRIYEAKLPRTLFTIETKTGKLTRLFTDSAWLNHVQFSPTDPKLMMFCHEGPWHKVDRIWTIDINTRKVKLMHKRTMDMEIAGHEWFGANGRRIWFDLQLPRGQTFFVAAADVVTGTEKKYSVARSDWSVHYTSSKDEKTFAGDGGDPGSVAKAKDGQWINLFTPEGDSLRVEKLVNMQHHQYRLEPNVHFSPDEKWIIFRANFEGTENVYAVEVKKKN